MKSFLVSVSLIFSLILAYYVGSRGIYTGVDTLNYSFFYNYLSENKVEFSGINEPFFIVISKLSLFFKLDFNVFLALVSFLSTFSLLLSYLLIFNSLKYKKFYNLLFFLICINIFLLSPIFWSAQINIIRAGLSVPFLYFSIHYFSKCSKNLGLIFVVISGLLHFFNIVLLIIFFSVHFFNKRKKNFHKVFNNIYIMIVIGYLTGFNKFLIDRFANVLTGGSYYASYFSDGAIMDTYQVGIRYDFSVFTLFFIAMLKLLTIKMKNDYTNNLFHFSAALTIPFFLVGHIPFSDRLLFPFWMFIPFIVSLITVVLFKGRVIVYYLILVLFFLLPINFYFSTMFLLR